MTDAHFVEPMPCLAVKKLPEGEAWQYELKLDGYRALAVKHDGQVTRPISCNDCPDFQRRLQMSVFSVGESLDRIPWVINTILKQFSS